MSDRTAIGAIVATRVAWQQLAESASREFALTLPESSLDVPPRAWEEWPRKATLQAGRGCESRGEVRLEARGPDGEVAEAGCRVTRVDTATVTDQFDLPAYLRRIRWTAPTRADLATLRALHMAHLSAIPFENLDIQMGLPIKIDAASIQASLVDRQRGGYCFQQNGLFRLALEAIGFRVQACDARVRLESGEAIRPRTHMVLLVTFDGAPWLTDVGFGASGIAEPLALGAAPVTQLGWQFRTVLEGRVHILQRGDGMTWEDLYAFGDEAVPHIDYVMGNWFTSTYPESGFVRSLTAQRIVDSRRHLLRNLTYSVTELGVTQSRDIAREELVPLLRDVFGLDVPPDARFSAVDDDAPRASP